MSPADTGAIAAVTIDPENPWLGLFSYSEETRAYFHGREEETGELARRVQRKPLTVLFGQSGLGKTSLLRAGLVPRLRGEGYCPVYVRIDYAPGSPPPSEQIKQAIFKATAAAGHWTRPGTAIEGESLWEFLHHREDLLRDAQGNVLMPLLIFDQFEEIFTLGQADDVGRTRAKEFLEDLADLVENRPPAALEKRLEHDEGAAEAFDFARADYRVLIALREDYLAHLEGVKNIMPSITQNRMRLARMTGAQALSAVVKPGGKLVSQEVAESIVRFIAGGSELANAEVEPSLLSLVCRELNTVRQSQGRAEISADLLAGSRDTILSEFYERALADQPAGVRRVIEDDLLTESGHRESLAEERVTKALAAAGAAPDSLAKLVDRRLLRIEERLDMRRVELTHDVLCSVVLSSRERRHEREARDEAERQLAAQREREAATHRALVRARGIAAACAVMMLIAIAGAVFGWVNLQRARAADEAAQRARGDAEKLIGFLIEDFYNELEPTGRLDTLGKLAHMTVGYYDGLPKNLMTPRTQTYRAMALAREGAALNARGDTENGFKKFAEAQAVFEQLHAAGATDPDVTYGLALVLYSQGFTALGGGGRGTPEQLQQAADLLKPVVAQKDSPAAARILYANALNVGSHFKKSKEDGVQQCEEALAVLKGLGALELTDLSAASSYADTADSEARHLMSLGRIDEAQKLEQEVYDLTEKLLRLRPNDLHALADRYYAGDLLSILALRRFDFDPAADYARRSVHGGEDYVRFDPSDLQSWGFWIRGLTQVADVEVERGAIGSALGSLHTATALAQDPRRPSSLGPLLFGTWNYIAILEGGRGQHAAAEQALQEALRGNEEAVARYAADDVRRQIFAHAEQFWRSRLRLLERDYKGALDGTTSLVATLDRIKIPEGNSNARRAMDRSMRQMLSTATAAALALDRGAEAETYARRWLTVPADPNSEDAGQDELARGNVSLAHALALQGRFDEARATLAPGFERFATQARAGGAGVTFARDYATALYVSALAQGTDAAATPKREAALAEAARLIAALPAEAREFGAVRWLNEKIATARGSRPG